MVATVSSPLRVGIAGLGRLGLSSVYEDLDALLQDDAWNAQIETAVIAPLALRQTQARQADARKAAATRVQFFTLATMRTS